MLFPQVVHPLVPLLFLLVYVLLPHVFLLPVALVLPRVFLLLVALVLPFASAFSHVLVLGLFSFEILPVSAVPAVAPSAFSVLPPSPFSLLRRNGVKAQAGVLRRK